MDMNENNIQGFAMSGGIDPSGRHASEGQMGFDMPPVQNAQSFSPMPDIQADHQSGGYAYYPQPPQKPKKKRGVLKAIGKTALVLVLMVAVGATSIFGYTMITGKTPKSDNDSSSASDSEDNRPAVSDDIEQGSKEDTRPERDVPSLEQLAALDNALPIPEIVDKVSPSVVGIICGPYSGTGFVISEDGYIVTNYHVIEYGGDTSVTFSISEDETEYEATLIGGDEQTDIAVLKIDKTGLTPVQFGISSDLLVGELAITIGNPLGTQLSGTVTAGIISALNRTLTVEDRTMTLIQTDASINSGNSGGPLINSYGQVIGITSAKIADASVDGLGFAIPIDEALPIISDLIEFGYVKGRPIVGITGENISDIYAQYYDIPKGFIVRNVTENGPAARAGVKVGDIVIGIEGTLIETVDEFNEVKEGYKAGETITISVYRDGEIVDIKITLDEDKSALENNKPSKNNNNYYYYNDPEQFFGFGY